VINPSVQGVNMVNVSCLGCVLAILVGLVQTALFVKSDLTANMVDALMNHLNANATASTMERLVTSQCAQKAAILNMDIAPYLNNVGAGLAGLDLTALPANLIGTASMDIAMTILGSAFAKKDGLVLIATAQKILMATGANGVNGASVQKLAALARDIAPARVTTQLQLEMEPTALMMEVHAMNMETATWATAPPAQATTARAMNPNQPTV